MSISLMLPTTASSEGSPASLPPPTPLSPTEPYPPPPQTANSSTSSGAGDHQNNNANSNLNGNNANNNKTAAPANAAEKRKTSRRANTAERRATHNAVERQRRETLNGRFLDLAALLPNLTSVRRPSKSAIVNSSIALIHSQRRQRATAARELRTLYTQFLSLKAECDEWRLRAGVPPVEDGERSKEFISLLELREEEEMGEEERGALRLAMSATANGGAQGNGGMRGGMSLDDDDDDDIIVPGNAESGSDVESFVHQAQVNVAHPHPHAHTQHSQAQQLHVQAAQAQAQAQAQYQQMRARASTFSHSSGIPSPVHGHGHHPYAAAYHSIPRPGSHGGLPTHHIASVPYHHPHPSHPAHPAHGHGHVLPFDNGSDLILASEPHLSQHASFGGNVNGVDIFSPTGSGPHTPGTGPTPGLEMLYGSGATGPQSGDYKHDWASSAINAVAAHSNPHHGQHSHPFAHAHPSMMHGYSAFDDSASTHSSSTGTGSAVNPNVNDGASPRSLVGGGSPVGSSVGSRSRAGSMVNGGLEHMKGGNVTPPIGMGVPVGMGGGMGGGAVMSMFF